MQIEKEEDEGNIWKILVNKHHCLKFDTTEAESILYEAEALLGTEFHLEWELGFIGPFG